MRKVLYISYWYPPHGWSGVQRTVKFVRYLPDFGWESVVLTPRELFQSVPEDPGMLNEVSHAVTVHTPMITHDKYMRFWLKVGYMLWPLLALRGRNAHWFADGMRWRYVGWLCPDYACGWIPAAVHSGLRAIRQHNPDIVFATAPPYSALLIGLILAKLRRLPFVVDFRDLWIDYPNQAPVARLREVVSPSLERAVVNGAQRVINVTDFNSEVLATKYYHLSRDRFTTIYNGYDQNDLPTPVTVERRGSSFHIAYVGSLYGKRTPGYFLRALESLAAEDPVVRACIRVRFVGHAGEHEKDLRQDAFHDMIQVCAPMDHVTAAQEMAKADVLLLIIAEGEEGVLTGKLFEYLASQKHILATVPIRGEAASVLRAAGNSTVVDVTDVAGIARALSELHTRWLKGDLRCDRDPNYIRRFERRELARQLAEVFDECS